MCSRPPAPVMTHVLPANDAIVHSNEGEVHHWKKPKLQCVCMVLLGLEDRRSMSEPFRCQQSPGGPASVPITLYVCDDLKITRPVGGLAPIA